MGMSDGTEPEAQKGRSEHARVPQLPEKHEEIGPYVGLERVRQTNDHEVDDREDLDRSLHGLSLSSATHHRPQREQVVSHGKSVALIEGPAPVARPQKHRIDIRIPAPFKGRVHKERANARASAVREDVDVGDVRVVLGLGNRIGQLLHHLEPEVAHDAGRLLRDPTFPLRVPPEAARHPTRTAADEGLLRLDGLSKLDSKAEAETREGRRVGWRGSSDSWLSLHFMEKSYHPAA